MESIYDLCDHVAAVRRAIVARAAASALETPSHAEALLVESVDGTVAVRARLRDGTVSPPFIWDPDDLLRAVEDVAARLSGR